MNTNDFSKSKAGDKLWDHVRGCECTVYRNEINEDAILVESRGNGYWFKKLQNPIRQTLFFSKPEIIAPPEPFRLTDYKPGEWIAVWDYGHSGPFIRKFGSFAEEAVVLTIDSRSSISWERHCSLSELPGVLAKWEEK